MKILRRKASLKPKGVSKSRASRIFTRLRRILEILQQSKIGKGGIPQIVLQLMIEEAVRLSNPHDLELIPVPLRGLRVKYKMGGPEYVTKFCQILSKNSTLATLDLYGNDLRQEGTAQICKALEGNKTIQ